MQFFNTKTTRNKILADLAKISQKNACIVCRFPKSAINHFVITLIIPRVQKVCGGGGHFPRQPLRPV